ncbi:MAG: sigma-54 dependent transcriptional regulator [Kiritimatiellia bacterium]
MNPDSPTKTGECILVVDDDAAILKCLERTLRDSGLSDVLPCNDSRQVLDLVRDRQPAVVLLDLIMPHLSGEELLRTLRAHAPELPVIVVTATDEVATAVRCIQSGAYDYLTKPLDTDRLLATLARALAMRRLQLENLELRKRAAAPAVKHPECFSKITTLSPAMLAVFSYIEAIAPSAEPVLIVGETGVGKERIAEALHTASGRKGKLVAVNVAGLDENAFADTLFGHTRGAFTGAAQARNGLVLEAAGGTLFLDEIGDLKPVMQTKLLRLIQEREFFPLGSDRPLKSDCRVVAATNHNLRARMRDGLFREDLFFRLHAHLVRVPPLRERTGDIPLLMDIFLEEASRDLGKPKPTPPRELVTYLAGYSFPGNIRELRAMIHNAVAQHAKSVLSLKTFLDHMDMGEAEGGAPTSGKTGADVTFGANLPTLSELTARLLTEALHRTDNNQSAAARMAGISRRTMNRYCITGQIGTPHDP